MQEHDIPSAVIGRKQNNDGSDDMPSHLAAPSSKKESPKEDIHAACESAESDCATTTTGHAKTIDANSIIHSINLDLVDEKVEAVEEGDQLDGKLSICRSDDGDCYLPDEDDDQPGMVEKLTDSLVDDDDVIEDDNNDHDQDGNVFEDDIALLASAIRKNDDVDGSTIEFFDEADDVSKKSASSFDCDGSLKSEYSVVTTTSRAALTNVPASVVEQKNSARTKNELVFASLQARVAFELLWFTDASFETASLPGTPLDDDLFQVVTPLGTEKDGIEVQTVASTPSKDEFDAAEIRHTSNTYLSLPNLVGERKSKNNNGGATCGKVSDEEHNGNMIKSTDRRKDRAITSLGNLKQRVRNGFASMEGASLGLRSASSYQNDESEDFVHSQDLEEDLESFSTLASHKVKGQDDMTTNAKKKNTMLDIVTLAFFGKFRNSSEGCASSSDDLPTDHETNTGTCVPSGGAPSAGSMFDDATIESNKAELLDEEGITKARHWLWLMISSSLVAVVIIAILFVIYAFTA